jgi:hypothetical protein
MTRNDLLKEMRNTIGTQEPVVFFNKMVDVFNLLFDRIDGLEKDLIEIKRQTTLSIGWEPRVASKMLSDQISILRQDKDTYFNELSLFKQAYAENVVTLKYDTFCEFWEDTLGYHPFLDYK